MIFNLSNFKTGLTFNPLTHANFMFHISVDHWDAQGYDHPKGEVVCLTTSRPYAYAYMERRAEHGVSTYLSKHGRNRITGKVESSEDIMYLAPTPVASAA